MSIKYIETDEKSIHLVKPLWEQLRNHHASLSMHFAESIQNNNFEDRARNLIHKSNDGFLQLILAYEKDSETIIGYCVSSINDKNQGEIDSIYITENYRGEGVGSKLIELSINWFKKHEVNDISISVMYGNEQALKFYEKYGFYPRTYILKNDIL